jgi:1-acyl-sn-glycerol-3-phosphate acyltransferase
MIEKLKNLIYFSPLSFAFQRLVSWSFLRFYYQVMHKTTFKYSSKKIDFKNNYIIISNHRSMKDPPLIGYVTGAPLAFIAKKELFNNPFLEFLITAASAIPIDRSQSQTKTFRMAAKALSTRVFGLGWQAVVFIEGTRSKDPNFLGRPNKGAMLIARMTKVPVLPVGISYRGNAIEVTIGEPYIPDYKSDLEDQAWDCLERISKLCDYQMPVR